MAYGVSVDTSVQSVEECVEAIIGAYSQMGHANAETNPLEKPVMGSALVKESWWDTVHEQLVKPAEAMWASTVEMLSPRTKAKRTKAKHEGTSTTIQPGREPDVEDCTTQGLHFSEEDINAEIEARLRWG